MTEHPFLARLEQLVASATAPSTTDQDLRVLVARHVECQPGRSARALEASQARSGAIRARFREAWGVRPLRAPMPVLMRLGRFVMDTKGLSIDDRTMRSELKAMQSEVGMSSQPVASRPSLTHRST